MRAWWSRLPRDSRVAVALALLVIVQTVALAAFGWAAARSRRAEAERDLRSFAELQLVGGVVEPARRVLAAVEAEVREAAGRGAGEALAAAVAPGLFDPAWALARDGAVTAADGEVVRAPLRRLSAAGVPAAVRDRIAELEAAAAAGSGADRVRDLLALGREDPLEAGRLLALQAAARAAVRAGEDTLALRAVDAIIETGADAVLDDDYPVAAGAAAVRFEIRRRRLSAGAPDAAPAFARAALAWRRTLLRSPLGPVARAGETAALTGAVAAVADDLPGEVAAALADDLARLDALAGAAEALRETARREALLAAARPGVVTWWRDADASGGAIAWCVARAPDGSVVARRTTAERLRGFVVAPALRHVALRTGTGLRLLGPDRAAVDGGGPSPEPGAALASHALALPTGTLLGEIVLEDPGLLDAEAAKSRRLVVGLFAAAALSLGLGALLVLRMVRAEVRFARMKASFVSSVSHELKTPLTSIRMFLETLREGRARTEEERRECLDILDRETERLDRLVHRVLEFSGRDGTAARLRPEPVDPAEVNREAARVFRGRLQGDGCDFRVETSNELEAAPLDRDAMVAVLLNLLENAWKYTPPTGKRIALRVAPGPDGGVRWEVEDNGPGVPPTDRERVFEEFWRGAQPGTESTGGTGLGLALARRLVEAHGGRILVEEGTADGSRFVVEIPGGNG